MSPLPGSPKGPLLREMPVSRAIVQITFSSTPPPHSLLILCPTLPERSVLRLGYDCFPGQQNSKQGTGIAIQKRNFILAYCNGLRLAIRIANKPSTATFAHRLNISGYRTLWKTNEEEQTRIGPAGKSVTFLPLLGDIAVVAVFRLQATGFHYTAENIRVYK